MQFGYVIPIVGILFFALHPHFTTETWLGMTALLAVVVTLYALFTRLWVLAAGAQLYLLYSVLQFLHLAVLSSADTKPAWFWAMSPLLALLCLSIIATQRRRLSDKPDAEHWLMPVSLIYRIVAVTISVPWVFRYIAVENHAWFFGLLGALCFAALMIKQNRELLIISGIYSAIAFLVLWFWIGDDTLTNWPNLLVILGLLAQGVISQKRSSLFPVPRQAHVTATAIGLATLWLWTSKWVVTEAGSFYLTATWAGLAFLIFAAGFLLNDKTYRWSGLAVLGCAIIRIGFVDIWRLGTIYRILSFMALGVVLLLVGLIYTKYQEKLRQWL
jgi:hypothetical protein